ARQLGIDKVLASRTLRAVAHRDPFAVLYAAPGPDPLRRLVRMLEKHGVEPAVVGEALAAVDELERVTRDEAGDRSALEALLSAWLPEARAEFELRRKQAAFRAISELRGVSVDTDLATVLLHPSSDGDHNDVVWLFGKLGLRRLRAGSSVKFATRRLTSSEPPRRPQTIGGASVSGFDGLRLSEFCSTPPPPLDVQQAGEVVHYTLGDIGVGPKSAVDLVFAEVNRAELPRWLPSDPGRKRHVFAEVATPTRLLIFDVLVATGVFPGEPALHIYDTAFDGIANVNDPARDIDRLDTCESVQALGQGIAKCRAAELPRYVELLRQVCERLEWNPDGFRGYRCRIEYPLYGTQVVMAFDPPSPRS
ncbi:MAG: hypothetical protein HUU27_13895, partial [Phycisphaerae bacterium]|nr:hypothetical protein [Phycisphaerae bacterium]